MAERLLAYSNEVSAAPGDRIEIKVSAPLAGNYHANLVRLICGDDSPDGPGFKAEAIPADCNGDYVARRQEVNAGSYVEFPNGGPTLAGSFTLLAMIWPTFQTKGASQAIIGNYDIATASGISLYVGADGTLTCRAGRNAPLSTGVKLLDRHWYLVSASYDAASQELVVAQEPTLDYGFRPTNAEVHAKLGAEIGTGGAFRLAAWNDGKSAAAHFNGKIDSPRVAVGLSRGADRQQLRDDPLDGATVAAWDFSRGIEGIHVTDVSGSGYHGRTFNLPTRAMTGWNWDGSEFDWNKKPAHYGAIHFHDDDLYDCGWATDFTVTLPPALKSGIYCVHLTQGDLEEFVPIFVRPKRGSSTARLALLIPTASYWAYANQQMISSWSFDELTSGKFATFNAVDRFLEEHPGFGMSTYDLHSDGSGVTYVSRLRPVLNMRPKTELWQFNADTHVTDWLEAKGIDYDVITDDDLHTEGLALLQPYTCVMTGTHPEYYTTRMLDAVHAYTGSGGRLVYLGANGFYWRVAYHEALPGVMEHRRAEDGMRGWISEGGEYYMSFNGELGGLWRRLGRAPNKLVGAGFTAQGFDHSSHYVRRPESFDPRAAFIFEGIGATERIGDFGTIGGGAAGWEVDRADLALGTPPHALIVAEATEFPASYHWVKEEMNHTHSAVNGDTCPLVRCDMLFFETPRGGAVFSTNSIAWAGSLSHACYQNNVSRITENVIRRFIDPTPIGECR